MLAKGPYAAALIFAPATGLVASKRTPHRRSTACWRRGLMQQHQSLPQPLASSRASSAATGAKGSYAAASISAPAFGLVASKLGCYRGEGALCSSINLGPSHWPRREQARLLQGRRGLMQQHQSLPQPLASSRASSAATGAKGPYAAASISAQATGLVPAKRTPHRRSTACWRRGLMQQHQSLLQPLASSRASSAATGAKGATSRALLAQSFGGWLLLCHISTRDTRLSSVSRISMR